MSGLLQNLSNFSQNWRPSPSKPVDAPIRRRQDNSDTMQRGVKRKANPYDDLDDAEDGVAIKTPMALRLSRSRPSSEAPSSSKSRPSAGKIKRRSLSLNKRPTSSTSTPNQAKSPAQIQVQVNGHEEDAAGPRGSRAPVADMGSSDLLSLNQLGPKGKSPDKDWTAAAGSAPEKPAEQDAGKLLAKALDEGGKEEEEDEVHEVEKLLKYRRNKDGSIDILVKWADGDETWEAEAEIQDGAADTLYEFWKKEYGGRTGELFEKGRKPPPATYFVFRILRHRKEKNHFVFEIQWVGYPATADQTTWESEKKINDIAKEMLKEYWEEQGGRNKFLAPRGRAKKQKTG